MRKGFKSKSSSKNKLGTYTLLVTLALSGQALAKDCNKKIDKDCDKSHGSSIFPYWLMGGHSNNHNTVSSSPSSSKSSFFGSSSSSRGSSSSFGG